MGACHTKTNKRNNDSHNTQLLPLNNKYKSKHIKEWDVNDVYTCLIDNDLHSVAKKFKKRNINGSQLISIEYLTNIKISIIHQQKLLTLIQSHSSTPNPRLSQTTLPPTNPNLVELNNKSSTVVQQRSFISSTSSKHTEASSFYTHKEPSLSPSLQRDRLNSLSINITKLNTIDNMPPLHEGKQTPPIYDLHQFRTTISNDTFSDIDELQSDGTHTPSVPSFDNAHVAVPQNLITTYSTGSDPNNTSNKPGQSERSNNNNQRNNDSSDYGNDNPSNFSSDGAGNSNNDGDDEKDNQPNKKKDNKDNDTKKKKKKNKDENKQDDEKQSSLNKDAPEFVPAPLVLEPIAEEDEKKDKQNSVPSLSIKISKSVPKNNGNNKKKIHNPFGVIGIIQVSRSLTDKIIPERIKENIRNLYEYMHKTTILNHSNEYENEKKNIRIFNYDFHDKQTGEILYCVALENGGTYPWKMEHNLYNENEIQTIYSQYNIKRNMLPKSLRQSHEYSNAFCTIGNICGQSFENIVKDTNKWSKKTVYTIKDKLYNQQRLVLYLTPEKLKQHLLCDKNIQNNSKLIPILVLNEKGYTIEYIKIVNVESINVGLSFKLIDKRIMITSIYLNEYQIINAHQLAFPNHICNCLNVFNCNINLLRIGNPDEDENKYKDLKGKYAKLQNENEHKNDNLVIQNTPSITYTPYVKSNSLQDTPSLQTPSVSSTPNFGTPAGRGSFTPVTPGTMMDMTVKVKDTDSKEDNV